MSKLKKPVPLYEDIRALVLSARQTITRGVDLLQVHTNYEIGRRIFEQEQQGANRAEYGKEVLNELAARLTAKFGAGFSRTNLASMRQFYVAYPDRVSRIVQTIQNGSDSPDIVWGIATITDCPDAVWTIGRSRQSTAARLYTELVALRLPNGSERGRAQLL
jgi:hypothetical protein